MLDAHQLNVFLTAAQTLNFSEAARRLNMSQPSVSQHIQALEQRFDARLFDRRGRHVTLTETGEALLPLARRLVNDSIQIEETMASLRGEVFGHLTIGCCTTAGRFLLPRLLARFHELHPNVRVTCHVTDQATALERLCEGKLHLAISSARDMSKDLEFVHFTSDPVVLLVRHNHPWAALGRIDPEALLDAVFVSREETSGTCAAVAAALPEFGLSFDQLDTVMVLGTSQAVAIAVEEGVGVAFVTKLAVTPALERGEVVEVDVRRLKMKQEVWIGRNARLPATRAQAEFWNYVTDPCNEILQGIVGDTSASLAKAI